MRNPVTILKTKYDGSVKRELSGDLVEMRNDWLVVYYTPARHSHLLYGAPVTHYESPHMLWYHSTTQPLTVLHFFDELGEPQESYVDAALPADLIGRTITYVDLDLDIDVFGDGATRVKDEDLFEENRVRYAYPPDVIAAAHEGIRLGLELIAARAFPLDGSASALLGLILASEGPL